MSGNEAETSVISGFGGSGIGRYITELKLYKKGGDLSTEFMYFISLHLSQKSILFDIRRFHHVPITFFILLKYVSQSDDPPNAEW